MQRLRALALVAALMAIAGRAANGQVLAAAAAPIESETTLKWAVTQGGLVVVVLVIIWSYRRDFLRIFNVERERTDMLLEVVKQATSALALHSESSRQQADAFAKAAQSIQMCEAVRQMIREEVQG